MASLLNSPSPRTALLPPNPARSPFPSPSRFWSTVRCKMVEPLKYDNGKPLLSGCEAALPNILAPRTNLENVLNKNDTRLRIFSGTANPALSQEIACYMGLELGKIKIKRFADGEIYVQLQESVRGCDVFLVQPTCPPANENLMELLIMIDACRRASAKNITAVIPYFGYARADRKEISPLLSLAVARVKPVIIGKYFLQMVLFQTQGRESIAAKLVANLITEAGANRVLACDLHSGQSMGYFDIPVDHVYGQPVILDYLASKTICSDDLVVVSPDVGGVARARAFAKKLSDAPLAIVDKRRHGHNVAEVMNLIGDVKGKVAVMVDDMIDTAGGGEHLLPRFLFSATSHVAEREWVAAKQGSRWGPQGRLAHNSWVRGRAYVRIHRRAHMGTDKPISGLTLLILHAPLPGVKRTRAVGRADGDPMAWRVSGVPLSLCARGSGVNCIFNSFICF
ncbi:hypothetical protein TIFTF001_031061 [Ficus carica]|uniref:Ribose-phosphate pyrophosphokinase n=1 Tax=Ficus carica TaxID=3494 RepID=A0AA88DW73_FICCA|nr:hypothetical protein TIFTF001_031061 [Ficus carica]